MSSHFRIGTPGQRVAMDIELNRNNAVGAPELFTLDHDFSGFMCLTRGHSKSDGKVELANVVATDERVSQFENGSEGQMRCVYLRAGQWAFYISDQPSGASGDSMHLMLVGEYFT